MKKTLFLCILVLTTVVIACIPQSSKVSALHGHETFLDIPIRGEMDFFGLELKRIGFKDANDGIEQEANAMYGHLYTGRYAGHDCFILVCGTLRSQEVFGVVVSFSDKLDDKSFNELKLKFNKKYGTPKQGKSILNSQNLVTVYSTNKGIIELTPASVAFYDKLNFEKFNEERVDDKI